MIFHVEIQDVGKSITDVNLSIVAALEKANLPWLKVRYIETGAVQDAAKRERREEELAELPD